MTYDTTEINVLKRLWDIKAYPSTLGASIHGPCPWFALFLIILIDFLHNSEYVKCLEGSNEPTECGARFDNLKKPKNPTRIMTFNTL